jgi:hypothetical protein
MPAVGGMHSDKADRRRHRDFDTAGPQITLDEGPARTNRGVPHIARQGNPLLSMDGFGIAPSPLRLGIGWLSGVARVCVSKSRRLSSASTSRGWHPAQHFTISPRSPSRSARVGPRLAWIGQRQRHHPFERKVPPSASAISAAVTMEPSHEPRLCAAGPSASDELGFRPGERSVPQLRCEQPEATRAKRARARHQSMFWC